MALELYNISAKTKIVPKFKYNGKIVLKSKETYPIEEYMAKFYTPYSKIGVVVRARVEKEKKELETDVEKVEETENLTVETPIESQTEETVKIQENDTINLTDSVESVSENESVSDISSETDAGVTEDKKVNVQKTSYEDLSKLTMRELREYADKLGIDTLEMNRKDPIIRAIIGE
jgi:hypothetical protein